MVKTKEIVSIEKFELSEKDKAEIKNSLPRLAKLFIKEHREFEDSICRNEDDFFNKLNLQCFHEMWTSFLDYSSENVDGIFDCEGFNDCFNTLQTMIKEYIAEHGAPKLTASDFDDDDEINDWINYVLDNRDLTASELRRKDSLDELISVFSKL